MSCSQIKCVTLLIIGVLAGAAQANENDPLNRATAPARPSVMWTPEGKPERMEFNFGGITGWIRGKGGWHIEGMVQHTGLLCGTYELGMRFGVGNPGCTDVTWRSRIEYGTRMKHCNSATQHHDGGGYLPDLAKEFGRITCAERVIRCTGNCK